MDQIYHGTSSTHRRNENPGLSRFVFSMHCDPVYYFSKIYSTISVSKLSKTVSYDWRSFEVVFCTPEPLTRVLTLKQGTWPPHIWDTFAAPQQKQSSPMFILALLRGFNNGLQKKARLKQKCGARRYYQVEVREPIDRPCYREVSGKTSSLPISRIVRSVV